MNTFGTEFISEFKELLDMILLDSLWYIKYGIVVYGTIAVISNLVFLNA